MREQLIKLLSLLVVLAIIFGIFWGLKRQNWVTIQQGDTAMEPEFSPGTYHLGVRPGSIDDIVVGKAYAYHVPGSPDGETRVSWAVAKEGQTVEFKDKTVLVNGVKPDCKVNAGNRILAPFVVPRGCVFLMATQPGNDSLTHGPIPVRNVEGQL